MADTRDAGYLSIGEVLGLLLEEYPDVTISKIRFLESQGLISPERTPSGYRKFYDEDVQLLRVILAEQQQNYLPLRVIKDRLDSGQIDPTGEHLRPNGNGIDATGGTRLYDEPVEASPVPPTSIASHPAARHQPIAQPTPPVRPAGVAEPPAAEPETLVAERAQEPEPPASAAEPEPAADPEPVAADPTPATGVAAEHESADDTPDGTPAPTQLLPGVLLERAELCAMVGMTDEELAQLESFGVVTSRETTGLEMFGEDAVEIARPAVEFLRAGVDARHLRNWRTSAEREASLFEQLVAPRFRQRNPEARSDALDQLRQLDALGGQLRAAMTKHALRHHFEG